MVNGQPCCWQDGTYRIPPTKSAGRSSKVTSYTLWRKLGFSAFQRWFRIENRTIIKEITRYVNFGHDSIGFLKTKGVPLLGEAPLIGILL